MSVHGAWLLLPFLLIRFGLMALLDKTALARAARFAPMEKTERPMYWLYQISRKPLIKSRLAAWHASRLHFFPHSAQLSFANRQIGCTQSMHSDEKIHCTICAPDLISTSLEPPRPGVQPAALRECGKLRPQAAFTCPSPQGFPGLPLAHQRAFLPLQSLDSPHGLCRPEQ